MNIKELAENIVKYISTRFKSTRWRDVFSFLFFLLIAFAYWMLLFSKSDVTSTIKYPIELVNVPDNVIFDNDIPLHISATISDKGAVIREYSSIFTKKDTIKIDVEKTINRNTDNKVGEGQISEFINSKLKSSSNLVRFSPSEIDISFSKLQEKKIEVRLDLSINPAASHIVSDSIQIMPRMVTAYASKKVLDSISEISTEYLEINNPKATTQRKVKLKTMEGVKFSTNEVDVLIPIEEITERTIETNIKCKNVPKGIDVKFFPNKVRVTFTVMISNYSKIKEEDFKVEIDYNTLIEMEDGKIELSLSNTSPFVRKATVHPKTVEFLLEKN